MEEILKLLEKYDDKYPHSGDISVTIFSDGSGSIKDREDRFLDNDRESFNSIEELIKILKERNGK